MSKTLEVLHDQSDNGTRYRIVSPDHEKDVTVNGVSFMDMGNRTVLTEDGVTRIDIRQGEKRYFHIEEDSNISHANILVKDHPQKPEVFEFPYDYKYTTSEKVSELGLPNKDHAKDYLRYMPSVKLEMEYDGKTIPEVTGVRIAGSMYDLEQR